MSISSIYGSYANNASVWNFESLAAEKNSAREYSANAARENPAAASGGKNSHAGMSSNLDTLASALSGIMDDMNLGANDKISFRTLAEYREKLQNSFTEQVKSDLRELGLDENTKFSLTTGADGTSVNVVCDDADAKAVIEKYLKDNPDVVTTFKKIQSLNKLEESRKSRKIDVDAIRDRLQVESMTAWFSTTSSVASFYSGGAAYYSGINAIA